MCASSRVAPPAFLTAACPRDLLGLVHAQQGYFVGAVLTVEDPPSSLCQCLCPMPGLRSKFGG